MTDSAPPMPARALGADGLVVSALGLGCMGLREAVDARARRDVQYLLEEALALGITLYDTADIYGPFISEELVGEFARRHRDQIVLATKFGNALDRDTNLRARQIDGRPEYVRLAIDGSLQRLGVDHVDLYYLHRVDPAVPIEETVGAMSELVTAGKVRYLGLSEAGPQTLRRAHAVHSITAIQTEWSLFSRDIERAIVPLARELGIGIVPYSPLGRGMLTDAIRTASDIPSRLRSHPRFAARAFETNMSLVTELRRIAEEAGVTPGQVALAWVLSRGDDVVPIPGTKHIAYLRENVDALAVAIPPNAIDRLERMADGVVGERSPRPLAVGVEAPPARAT